LNGDTDLTIAARGESNFAGLVDDLYGSVTTGLSPTGSDVWSQYSPGITGRTELGDEFGFNLQRGSAPRSA
jgi:hypothetical protein